MYSFLPFSLHHSCHLSCILICQKSCILIYRSQLTVNTSPASETIPFSKNKLLQITGNLISNAIKFTPNNGFVIVDLDLIEKRNENILQVKVTDSGVGLDADGIAAILQGNAISTNGTGGENGYGFGLALAKHLVESLKGTFNIFSVPEQGATFEVKLPQASSPEI